MIRVDQLPLGGKRTFIRTEFDVPLIDGRIVDETRIARSIPTIRYALDHDARVIIGSSLGRPSGGRPATLSLAPVAAVLTNALGRRVGFHRECVGADVEIRTVNVPPGEAVLLENLRFHSGEQANDRHFGVALARLADVYVSDAFGGAHRSHASIVRLPRLLPRRAIGFLMHDELSYFDKLLDGDNRPTIAIIGGDKLADKLALVEATLDKVDTLLVGGLLAYAFLNASGYGTGDVKIAAVHVTTARELLAKARDRKISVTMPLDHVTVRTGERSAMTELVMSPDIPAGLTGVDIGPRTVEVFESIIATAHTVFWNGPLGICERNYARAGTVAVIRATASSIATSVVGGGDTTAAVSHSQFAKKISHISTGGGAMLTYLSSRELVGLRAIADD